nr:chymotrypsin-like protease CTRL-1 [Misgurnus anguillicaudatus]
MNMKLNTVLSVTLAVLLNLTGSFCQLDVCGQAPLNTKFIGEKDANAGSWPWQVSINEISYQNHFCGGSLINKDWVLSAAHCFQSIGMPDIVIYLGRQNQQGPNPLEINRTVIQLIIHPNYDPDTQDNDIALLQLSSSVNFTDYIKPVCLAAAGSEFDEGLSSWVTGWGASLEKIFPDMFQQAEIPIVSNNDCNIGYNGIVTDNMLCAGLLNDEGESPCQYDAGGPLVSKQGSRWIQSGIVSFNQGCLELTFPSVFTRVSQYQDWINIYTVNNQPGFVTFPDDYDYALDPISNITSIFSGSSTSLYLPLNHTFSIATFIFCFLIQMLSESS